MFQLRSEAGLLLNEEARTLWMKFEGSLLKNSFLRGAGQLLCTSQAWADWLTPTRIIGGHLINSNPTQLHVSITQNPLTETPKIMLC